jgi:hypothetical protein
VEVAAPHSHDLMTVLRASLGNPYAGRRAVSLVSDIAGGGAAAAGADPLLIVPVVCCATAAPDTSVSDTATERVIIIPIGASCCVLCSDVKVAPSPTSNPLSFALV